MGFRIPSDMGNGSAYVAVGADYLDEVEEVDEGNNGVVKRFNLYERGPSTPPNETRVDLEVEVGRVLGRFTRGGYASIEFLVHNHGPEIPLNYLDYVRVEYWSNLSAVHQTASLYSLVVDEYPDARGLQSWRCNVVIGIPFYDSWVKALEFRIRVSSSVIHDTNPTNDEDSAVIVLEEGRPDLAIQYIRISPDPVRAGEGFSVVVGVVNMGYGTAAAGFRVRVFEGHPILERDLTVGVDIPSGESCDIVLQYGPEVWEQLASFPSTFCSIVDVDDVVEEEVEGNNEKCLVLDLPNLEWSRIELDGIPTGISITVPDNTVAPFTAFIAAVLPPGQLETGGFRARVVLREAEGGRLVYEEEFEIASMTRGEERVVNVEVPFGGAGGGDYLLEFQLDVDNAVAESDEEDNVRRVRVHVRANERPLIVDVALASSAYDPEQDVYYLLSTVVPTITVYCEDDQYVDYISLEILDESGAQLSSSYYQTSRSSWVEVVIGPIQVPLPVNRVLTFRFKAYDGYGAVSEPRDVRVKIVDCRLRVENLCVEQAPGDVFRIPTSINSLEPVESHTVERSFSMDLVNEGSQECWVELRLRGVPDTLLEGSEWEGVERLRLPSGGSQHVSLEYPISRLANYYQFMTPLLVGSQLSSELRVYLDLYVAEREEGPYLKFDTIDLSLQVDQPLFQVASIEKGEVSTLTPHPITVKIANLGSEAAVVDCVSVCEVFGEGPPECSGPKQISEETVPPGSALTVNVRVDPGSEHLDYKGDVVVYAIVRYRRQGSEGGWLVEQTPLYYVTSVNSELSWEVETFGLGVLIRRVTVRLPRGVGMMIHVVPRGEEYRDGDQLYLNRVIIVPDGWREGYPNQESREKGIYASNIFMVAVSRSFYLYVDPARYREPTVTLDVYKYNPETGEDEGLVATIVVDTSYVTHYHALGSYTPLRYGWHFTNWGSPSTCIVTWSGRCCGMSLISLYSYSLHRGTVPLGLAGCLGEAAITSATIVGANYPVTLHKSDVEDYINKAHCSWACSPLHMCYSGAWGPIVLESIRSGGPKVVGLCGASHAVLISGWMEIPCTPTNAVYFYGYDPNSPMNEYAKMLKENCIGPVKPILIAVPYIPTFPGATLEYRFYYVPTGVETGVRVVQSGGG